MNNEDKLLLIFNTCKCSVTIENNGFKDYYQKVDDAIEEIEEQFKLSDEIKEGMKRTDTIISIQCYTETPIGFYKIHHYDLSSLLDIAIQALKIDPKK